MVLGQVVLVYLLKNLRISRVNYLAYCLEFHYDTFRFYPPDNRDISGFSCVSPCF